MQFEAGKRVSLDWEWESKNVGALPPGAEVWWQWELHTSAGDTLTTEKKTQMIENDDLNWQEISGDGMCQI